MILAPQLGKPALDQHLGSAARNPPKSGGNQNG
jgi:hypothetical protein